MSNRMHSQKSNTKKQLKTSAFIDAQNLNLGVKSQGWKLVEAYLFIGYKPGNEALYTNLQKMGYLVILKPTMELPDGTVKGNVDAELVLHTMIQYENYKKAIIVSGDGDFFCLVEYLANQNKLLHVLTPNKHYSKLFKPYSSFVVRIDQLKGSLEQKKTGIGGRSKP